MKNIVGEYENVCVNIGENIVELRQLNDEELFELLDQIDYDERENEKLKSLHLTDEEPKIQEPKIEQPKIEEPKIQEPKKNSNNFCSECKTSDNIVEDNTQGIMVCKSCGNVVANIMDENPEWRQYGGDDSKTELARCSMPTNFFLPQSSLGTTIAGNCRSKIKTLHNWSAMPYKERSLHLVLKEIQSKCRSSGILKCIEDDAKILYKNISECKHLRGKNKDKSIIIRGANRRSLIAACVFFACKRKGNTRSPKEIAKIFDLKYTDITKGCKTFLKLMKIKKMEYEFNSSSPEHFVKRFCKALHINNELIEKTIQLAKNIQKLNIASVHTPLSIATGSILLMADMNNLPITKKTIAVEFEVSEVTIAKTFKKLEFYKRILVNDELSNKLVKILEEENEKIKMPTNLKEKYDNIKLEFPDELEAKKENNFDKRVEIDSPNIEEYFDNFNIDLFEQLSITDDDYNMILSMNERKNETILCS